MPEKEYIDRAALLAAYDRVHVGPPGGARKLIEESPGADVVEVVRCRDCAYWDRGIITGRCEGPRNGLVREYTDDDDYCSYGKRRSTEGANNE